jgi:hypothetical protein
MWTPDREASTRADAPTGMKRKHIMTAHRPGGPASNGGGASRHARGESRNARSAGLDARRPGPQCHVGGVGLARGESQGFDLVASKTCSPGVAVLPLPADPAVKAASSSGPVDNLTSPSHIPFIRG